MAGSAAFEVAVWSKGASAAMAAPLDRGLGRLDLARVLVLLLAVRRWWAVLAAGWFCGRRSRRCRIHKWIAGSHQ